MLCTVSLPRLRPPTPTLFPYTTLFRSQSSLRSRRDPPAGHRVGRRGSASDLACGCSTDGASVSVRLRDRPWFFQCLVRMASLDDLAIRDDWCQDHGAGPHYYVGGNEAACQQCVVRARI